MKFYNVISYFILAILIILVFKSWLFGNIISAGDSWYYFPSMFDNAYLHPYAWYLTGMANGLGAPGYVSQNVNIVIYIILFFAKQFHLSWEVASKLLFFIPYILISLATNRFLITKIFPNNRFWVFASIIFVFNSYVLLMAGGGQIITAISYALMPLVIYLFIKLLDLVGKEKIYILKYSIVCFLVLEVQMILDLRIAFIASISVFLWLIIDLVFKEKNRIKSVEIFIVPFILLTLANLFWLMPLFFYGIDPIQQLGLAYGSSDAVRFLSFAKLENSIGLMHPYWPENIFGKISFMKPEFLLLPILAFASLLYIKKGNKENKYILYFAFIGLLGIFLGKGANEPFGNLYIFLFEHIPGFQLFRDSFKWYTLIAISFSMLIPNTIENIYRFIKNKDKVKKTHLELLFMLLIVIGFIYIFRPALFGQLNGTYKSRNLPESYIELNNYLSSDSTFYRTFWIPQSTLFGYYSDTHPSVSGRDFLKEYSPASLAAKLNDQDVKNILENASVKYVIVPEDTESDVFVTDRKYDDKKYQNILSILNKNEWLTLNKTFGKIKVYETKNHKSHLWCDCNAVVRYKMINPTHYKVIIKNFKEGDVLIFSEGFDKEWVMNNNNKIIDSQKFEDHFNSFALTQDGEYDLVYAPQKYTDVGFKISILTLTISIGTLLLIVIRKNK